MSIALYVFLMLASLICLIDVTHDKTSPRQRVASAVVLMFSVTAMLVISGQIRLP